MKKRSATETIFLDYRWFLAVSAAIALIYPFTLGLPFMWCYLIGLIGTLINTFGLYGIIHLLGASFKDQAQPKGAAVFLVLLFFIKLPVMIGLMMYARTFGEVPANHFFVGLGVVYCWAIGWSQTVKR